MAAARWGPKLAKEARQACGTMKMDAELLELLVGSFECCFGGSPAELERHPEWLHPLTESQDAAGWEQAPYGRLPRQWSGCQGRNSIELLAPEPVPVPVWFSNPPIPGWHRLVP